MKEATIEEVKDFEKRFDQVPLSSPILKQPKNYSIWWLLVALEWQMMKSYASAVNTTSEDSDNLRNALKHCFRWLIAHGKESGQFRAPQNYNRTFHISANDFLELGKQYHHVFPCFVWRHHGNAKAYIHSDYHIEFRRDENEIRYDALNQEPFSKHVLETRDKTRCYFREDGKASLSAVQIIRAEGKRAFDATIPHELLHKMMSQIEVQMKAMRLFPEGWKCNNICIDDCRKVWYWLVALSNVNTHLCIYERLTRGRKIQDLATQLIQVVRLEELLHKAQFELNISSQCVKDIFDLLIYRTDSKYPDPAVTPLIHISEDRYAISPTLFVSNNFERNLQIVLSEKHKEEYNRKSHALEVTQLKELGKVLKAGLEFKKNIAISKHGKKIEIDFAIYDTSTPILVLGQAKSLIEVAEPREVLRRAESIKDGICQCDKMLEFEENAREEVWKGCGFSGKRPNGLTVKGIVVVRGHEGVHLVNTHGSVIEQELLIEKLRSTDNLSQIVNWIENKSFLPVVGKDIRVGMDAIEFGEFTVDWEKYMWIRK